MSEIITLKGIAWDHPRGYEPLRATSDSFNKMNPDVFIEWDIRSLKEFGDMPIEDLIESYDLITIDHPYMGQAHANNLLVPLEDYISKDTLLTLKRESVGPSFESYYFNGHQYALPVDAAALVSANRKDLIESLNLDLPNSRSELLNFYKKVPSAYKVAWALCATDLWCTFLSLCAQDSNGNFIKNQSIDTVIGTQVLDELKRHLENLHPESLNWNPIQILDYMGENDGIIYSPFLFGYTNYSRADYTKYSIDFGNSPKNPKTNVSTILGGVGLAISERCNKKELAVEYISYVANSETQSGEYTLKGGQPGNLKAWKDEVNNVLCNNFFTNTLDTMQQAYVRPQHMGWNGFQEQGAELLHKGLLKNISSLKLMKELNHLYQSIKK